MKKDYVSLGIVVSELVEELFEKTCPSCDERADCLPLPKCKVFLQCEKNDYEPGAWEVTAMLYQGDIWKVLEFE